MVEASQFKLKVTAGDTYDVSKQQQVNVNTSNPVHIESDYLDASIRVRVKNYRGLPEGSPADSPYFTDPSHTSDLYSISFSFTPKSTLKGNALLFGNDFDHPIRSKLPPGFNTALRIVKWAIDPGIDGDAYADEPYLYGPLLSSVNRFRVGLKQKGEPSKPEDGQSEGEEQAGEIVEEGADGDGEDIRHENKVPDDAKARQTFFLQEPHRDAFSFEAGREYHCDFFNGYLDFNDFSLKLPGFTLQIMSHWDGQPLRYVLKLRHPDKPVNESTLLFVVCFTLIPKDQETADAVDSAVPLEKPVGDSGNQDDQRPEPESKDGPNYVDEGVD